MKNVADVNEYIFSAAKERTTKKSGRFQKGYTLLELVVTLSILSFLTVSMVSFGFGEKEKIAENAFNAECEKILYTLLQYQNEAIMDGCPRKIRFLDQGMQVNWTKDSINHQTVIPVATFRFFGAYTGLSSLKLYGSGTVSTGGTVKLTSPSGSVRKIIIQPGNGRIYLDEP
ncbi:prepilin-type N-terminal cleavage/methylation domain-containing protein [Acetobacterium fimetarium]|uniref:Prepilin-type N-terminal cleavage/methylation domain-containing protein n=1 Tax=Acetobacterium fimetarium TaxID=52691 RepID=A0ABR6WTW0_9FIRM|nr:GspH/FimT family protein [Acetobacterium fimetarium]MBC3803848.1 prepilin-type N-terminal cleavage/methylation domain-containing protein [Acetobacterium fimetarium]